MVSIGSLYNRNLAITNFGGHPHWFYDILNLCISPISPSPPHLTSCCSSIVIRLLRVRNSTMPKNPQAPPKSYQCHRCSRLFSRSEHLQRHERSRGYKYSRSSTQTCIDKSTDTKEKPFRCPQCPKSFTRK